MCQSSELDNGYYYYWTNDPKATVGILVEHMNQPSIADELKVMVIDPLDWRSQIIDYLSSPFQAT